jgi:hypothetical protein
MSSSEPVRPYDIEKTKGVETNITVMASPFESQASTKPGSLASAENSQDLEVEKYELKVDPEALPTKKGNKLTRYLECKLTLTDYH